jgi:glucosamine--fructose-6-phosphate aminotransferase (isomerizing)
VVALGEDESFLASDALAVAGTANRIIYLEEGDVVELARWRADRDVHDHEVERERAWWKPTPPRSSWARTATSCRRKSSSSRARWATRWKASPRSRPSCSAKRRAGVREIDSVLILACGTSYYSGCTAKYWLESIAKIPTQVEVASEYRYRDTVPNPRALVVVISQSGETADTMAALRHARSLGHTHTLAICNVATSAMVRETELRFLTRAGTEIGVASTKAFTTQLAALFMLTLALAKVRGHLTDEQEAEA